ncbi:MAG TPA: hypothetical protein PK683_09895, partial [Leptospiraceae bacterium]|nr:hypothetical protein [Leptospiraceae bacterium]
DITYYILKMMSWVGLVWDLKPVPAHVLDEGKRRDALAKGKETFKDHSGQLISVNANIHPI